MGRLRKTWLHPERGRQSQKKAKKEKKKKKGGEKEGMTKPKREKRKFWHDTRDVGSFDSFSPPAKGGKEKERHEGENSREEKQVGGWVCVFRDNGLRTSKAATFHGTIIEIAHPERKKKSCRGGILGSKKGESREKARE